MSKKAKRGNLLPLIAAVVVIAAVAVSLRPKNTEEEDVPVLEPQSLESTSSVSNDIVIQAENIGIEASYFDYDADGITVQFFAVRASDDTIRMALNTCQVCNGSPMPTLSRTEIHLSVRIAGTALHPRKLGLPAADADPSPSRKISTLSRTVSLRFPRLFWMKAQHCSKTGRTSDPGGHSWKNSVSILEG